MLLTIFTPVYNRAYCLHKLYKSLCHQSCTDFEWIIVDDGSSDNIDDVVNEFINDNWVKIKYYKKKNGGKHTAINFGVNMAEGEMFYIVDSDDYIPDDAVQFIIDSSLEIVDDDSYVGISGCDITAGGTVLSNILSPISASSLDIRYKYKIVGDLAEVFKTRVLAKYPFPEITGERFCPEALVWNRMATDGLIIKYYPKILKIIEYMPDGLTAGIVKARMNSPILALACYGEMVKNSKIPQKQRVKASINYWRFWFCLNKKSINISLKWLWTFPFGAFMHFRDLKRK